MSARARAKGKTRSRISRAGAIGSLSNQEEVLSDGEHTGHTAPDQIDPQHRANHEGDANGRSFEDAARATARSRGTSVCRVDEQSARFAPKADRSDVASTPSDPGAEEGISFDH